LKINSIFIKILFLLFFTSIATVNANEGINTNEGINLNLCKKLRLRLNPSVYFFENGSTGTLNLLVEQPPDFHSEDHKTTSYSCSFFIGFGNGEASSSTLRRLRHPSHALPLQIWKENQNRQTLKDLPEAKTNQDVFNGVFSQESFWVRLYEGSVTGKNSLVDSVLLTLYYRQPKIAEVSLVDTGSPFDRQDQNQVFDFGTLQQGQTKSCDIVSVYNAGLRIWMSSAHRGFLKSSEMKRKFSIPYETRINGIPVSWPHSGFIKLDSRRGRSSLGGLRHNLETTIGPLGAAPAGEYRDQITIRVESTE